MGRGASEGSVADKDLHYSLGSYGGPVCDKGGNGCTLEDDPDVDCHDGENRP